LSSLALFALGTAAVKEITWTMIMDMASGLFKSPREKIAKAS
jgi:hypothetical protein